MKRIIIYGDTMNLSGGRERVIANLMNEWIADYEITFIVKDSGHSYYPIPDKVKIVSLEIPMKLNLNSKLSRIVTILQNLAKSIRLLKKTLRKLDFDYLYVSTPLNAFEAFYALEDPEKRLIISEHASINSFNCIYTWMKHNVYSKSYCISVPNRMDTEEYCKQGCNAIYIPHTLTFQADKKNSLSSKIMLNVGRLTGDKQQALLIKTWANIKNKKGWKLWIVGDGEEECNLRSLINDLSIGDTVSLFPATKKIREIYQQASCFILTSRCEGFGMVLLEAMAFGIPCISFDCPSGPRDIVVNTRNGFLVTNNSTLELQTSIENLINMPEQQLRELGDNAHKTILGWDNAAILKTWKEKVFK